MLNIYNEIRKQCHNTIFIIKKLYEFENKTLNANYQEGGPILLG